ncbi:MAG: hypothetical protein O3C20_22320 [Verrucomicrobia bacterium]|nr:hypothetical protein [Verrucomicrobiota bacterium]
MSRLKRSALAGVLLKPEWLGFSRGLQYFRFQYQRLTTDYFKKGERGQTQKINIDLGRSLGFGQRMPRKQRVEFAGAVYRNISLGNHRKDLFSDDRTTDA